MGRHDIFLPVVASSQGEHSLLVGDGVRRGGLETFWVCETLSSIPSGKLFGA